MWLLVFKTVYNFLAQTNKNPSNKEKMERLSCTNRSRDIFPAMLDMTISEIVVSRERYSPEL
jgi:hypothetical protein